MYILYRRHNINNITIVDNDIIIGEVIMSKSKRWKDIKKVVKRDYLRVKEVKPDKSYASTKNVLKVDIIGKAMTIKDLKANFAELLF